MAVINHECRGNRLKKAYKKHNTVEKVNFFLKSNIILFNSIFGNFNIVNSFWLDFVKIIFRGKENKAKFKKFSSFACVSMLATPGCSCFDAFSLKKCHSRT